MDKGFGIYMIEIWVYDVDNELMTYVLHNYLLLSVLGDRVNIFILY